MQCMSLAVKSCALSPSSGAPNCANAAYTALEFRYLTRWALNADKSSLKSRNIQGPSLHCIGSNADVHDGANPFARWQPMPFPVFGGSHRLETVVLRDALVHSRHVTTIQVRARGATPAGPNAPLLRPV